MSDEADGQPSLLDDLRAWSVSASPSLPGLHEIIERHELTPNNSANVSNYGFFIDACNRPSLSEEILRCLLEYFPDAAGYVDIVREGCTPLQMICQNRNATLDIFQLLINAAPDSVRSVDIDGDMPLHYLCCNSGMDETVAIEILKLLMEKCPESIRHADNKGRIPLHYAAWTKSPDFCGILVEAYPGSECIRTGLGLLPLHCACNSKKNLATVEFFYNLYPDAINRAIDGLYPIHGAIRHLSWWSNRQGPFPFASDIVKFLLNCDPNVKSQKIQGKSLLHYACALNYNDNESIIDIAIQVIKMIYDELPEAIESDELISSISSYHTQVQAFLNGELVYARQAKDPHPTRDGNGQLQHPLHAALQNNVRLGSIKLLVRGNPTCDSYYQYYYFKPARRPLHVACQYHDSLSVIRHLLEVDTTTLCHVDSDGNTALHYACLGAKYDTIVMLLEEYNAASVSTWNVDGKLPIDLLFESDGVEDRASIKYLDCVFRLLKASPQRLLQSSTTMKQ